MRKALWRKIWKPNEEKRKSMQKMLSSIFKLFSFLQGNNIWSNPAVSNMTKNKNSSRIDLTFMFNLRSWMLWSPVWLPMIFVITPPLSEYCNLRTLVFLLFFIRWNQRYLSQWTHLLKNASWSTFLHAIFVPRLWPTRIEIHCDTCESNLAEQLQIKVC